MPAMIPGAINGKVTSANTRILLAPSVPAASSSSAVDGFQGKPNRADQQRKAHYCAGECRPGPAKREDDAERFFQKSAERPVATEQQQQQVTGHDRRHHERQMDHAVEQALAVKSPARQNYCCRQPKGQAADRRPERDAKAQPHRLDFGCAEIDHVVFPDDAPAVARIRQL